MEKSNYFSNHNAKKNKHLSRQRLTDGSASQSETKSTSDSFYNLSPTGTTKPSLKSKKKENLTSNNKNDESNCGNYPSQSKSKDEDNVNLDDSAEVFTEFSRFRSQKANTILNNDKQSTSAYKSSKENLSKSPEVADSFLKEVKLNSLKNKIGLSCYEYQQPPCIQKSTKVDCKSPVKKEVPKNENSTDGDWLQENENKNSLVTAKQCPLCFKFVEKHISHMKSCATKRNVSTQQLLAALRLQEKQTAERQALGLPTAPERALPRKNIIRKGPMDSNMELALALSVSMQEQEENKVLQEADVLYEAGLEEEANLKRSTLENFGFATSKPVVKTVGGKNKSSVTPVLLKRTKEDRERIITEKVAIILVGEDEACLSTLETFPDMEPRVRSKKLTKYLDKEITLWKKSVLSDDQSGVYYVENLSEFVSPSKTEISAGLRHLSQLPGRMNTPIKDGENNFDKTLRKFPTPSSDIIKTPKHALEKTPLKHGNKSIKNVSTLKKTDKNKLISVQNDLSKNLSRDWHLILGKKYMSDITIYCKDEIEIPAHKLVLFIRCKSALVDVIKESDCYGASKDMLFWSESSRDTCMAFLEYIYCGSINKTLILNEKELNELKSLAKKYNVVDLLDSLKIINSSTVSLFETKGISRSLFNDDQSSSLTIVEQNVSNKLQDNTSDEDLNVYDMSTIVEKSQVDNTDLESEGIKPVQSPDMFFESDNEIDELAQNCSQNNLDLLINMVDKSQFKHDLSKSNNFTENVKNNSFQNAGSDCDTNEYHNYISSESPNSIKSIIYENFERKSQKICEDSEERNNLVNSPKCGYAGEDCDSDYELSQKLDSDNISDRTQIKKFNCNSRSENFSEMIILSEIVNSKCNKGCGMDKTQKFNSSSSGSPEQINFSESSSSRNSQSILRNSFTESKRKRSEEDVTENENNLSNKKICVDDNILSQGSKNEADVFDLTQSSENTSDKVIILSGGSQDSVNNEANIDRCRLSPLKISDVSRLRSPNTENNEPSVYIDPVWDGFDEMNFNHHDYASRNDFSVHVTPEKCDSVEVVSPINCNISDEDTLSSTTFNNRKRKKKSCETVDTKESGISGSDFSLYLEYSPDTILNNNRLSPNSNQTTPTTPNSNLNSTKTPLKNTILDLSKLSPENIVIIDSESNSPILSCKPVLSDDKPLTSTELLANSKPTTPRDSLSSFKRLLDDSLEISDSVFSENVRETEAVSSRKSTSSGTSMKTPSPAVSTSSKVTPLPDYSGMKTPALKKELSRYGLKPSLGRKKGKLMLRYIYDELHPVVPQSPKKSEVDGFKESVFKSPDKSTTVPKSPCKTSPMRRLGLCSELDDEGSQSSSCSNSSSCPILEESIHVDSLDFDLPETETLSQNKCLKLTAADIPPAVKSLIYSDPDLHQKILLYEPIFLEDLVERLKVNGFKCKLSELMDYLDEQCVTFRSLQGVKNRQKAQLRRETRKKRTEITSQLPTSPLKSKRGRKKKNAS